MCVYPVRVTTSTFMPFSHVCVIALCVYISLHESLITAFMQSCVHVSVVVMLCCLSAGCSDLSTWIIIYSAAYQFMSESESDSCISFVTGQKYKYQITEAEQCGRFYSSLYSHVTVLKNHSC